MVLSRGRDLGRVEILLPLELLRIVDRGGPLQQQGGVGVVAGEVEQRIDSLGLSSLLLHLLLVQRLTKVINHIGTVKERERVRKWKSVNGSELSYLSSLLSYAASDDVPLLLLSVPFLPPVNAEYV